MAKIVNFAHQITIMASFIKHSGQVFTPDYLVNLILDEAGYVGSAVLGKHCIDNSCGDGAFLCEIVSRYISAYIDKHRNTDNLASEIGTYIHGIELDPVAFNNCLHNLKVTCGKFGVECEQFDVVNEDALQNTSFDGRMDYVVGNPPYVRVHNLENSYDIVKSFSFANGGMTDLYLVFFEKGFRMLNQSGKLCYITPSSWLNSVAGGAMRNYIRLNHNLISLIDLGHYQAFNATTYTMISLFVKGYRSERFSYYNFDETTLNKVHIADLLYSEIDVNTYFYLANHKTLADLHRIVRADIPRYVTAKNGFATLADKVFIASEFPFTDFLVPIVKASTGKWYKAFFPYDSNGKPYSKGEIFSKPNVASYLNAHKGSLLKDCSEDKNVYWYLFGRTQALKDVFSDKLSINTTIKGIDSIKLTFVPAGSGLYSGLYIMSDVDFDVIKRIILTDKFVNYIASLKKYKSGGYYTFNSKDLEIYLNYEIHQLVQNGSLQIPIIEQQGLFAYCY